MVNCSLYLLLRVPESLPEEKRFDMMMLALIFLINLVEQCDDNKQLLIEARAPPTLDEIFDGTPTTVIKSWDKYACLILLHRLYFCFFQQTKAA